ncbi:hypothetical protein FLM48_00310 [Shewanella sp. Scap07]|uniref:hypothetical protein n=1 Tax=Shewanella sp. Scap07 TaxID=2589987 RepID=UPI0015BB3842|nr:hypothetical protein [Shewanella sp. Scap07]QLE83664.1 hypothetical protein FLM48_00310 [Shewanella sp. Scap07]
MANNPDQYGGVNKQIDVSANRPSFKAATTQAVPCADQQKSLCHILSWGSMVAGYKASINNQDRQTCVSNLQKLYRATGLIPNNHAITAACQNANRDDAQYTADDRSVLTELYNSVPNLYCGWQNTNASIQQGLDVPCNEQSYHANNGNPYIEISGQALNAVRHYNTIEANPTSPIFWYAINRGCNQGNCNNRRIQSSDCEGDLVNTVNPINVPIKGQINQQLQQLN